MTQNEFRTWWADYCGKFPSVAAWFERLGEDAGGKLIQTWVQVLADTPLRGALQVNHAMAMGDLEPVGSYDSERERTAVFIRRAAKARHDAAQPRVKADPGPPPPIYQGPRKKRPEKSIRDLIADVERLVKSGRTRQQACDEAMPIDETAAQRYKCAVCLDSGLVTVWSVYSIRVYRTDPALLDERVNRRTMAAPCHCELGVAKVWTDSATTPKAWAGWTDPAAIYDPRRHCRAVDVSDEEELEAFRVWCSAYFDGLEYGRTQRMAEATPYKE